MKKLFAIVGLLAGCGGAAPPPASGPAPLPSAPPASEAPARPQPPAADPFAISGLLRDEAITAPAYDAIATPLPAAPKALPPPPPACTAFVQRKKAGKAACKDVLASLDAAIAEPEQGKRDALLLDLEACAELAPGVARALRAEYAPLECGDAIAAPLVGKAGPSPELQHALTGLAVAARLARTGARAPRLAPPHDKERVLAFIKGPLKDWFLDQGKLIEDLSTQASRLHGYGQALAAVEAGVADLRFVEVVRAVPLPDSFAKDPELRAAYEGALDQMLEPRKDRGRDAALVGLRELAAVGVIKDTRVERARALLGKMYAGRRIDALDALILPPLAEPPLSSLDAAHRLAARLPTFYAGVLLDPKDVSDKDGLALMASRGLPARVRAALKPETVAADARVLVSHARLRMGCTYWRAVDFDQAAAFAKEAGGGKKASPEADVLLALALAMRGGPEDAAQMMRKPAPEGLGIGDVKALDAIGDGVAAFDAAWIKRVGAPRAAEATYWRDVARRFRAAEGLLSDAAAKLRAADAAREADAIAAQAK